MSFGKTVNEIRYSGRPYWYIPPNEKGEVIVKGEVVSKWPYCWTSVNFY